MCESQHKQLEESVVVHRLPVVIGCALVICRWLSAIVHCRSCVVRRWSSVVHRWSLAVGCRWSSSLIVVGDCRRKARLYIGRVVSGLSQASGHLKKKKKGMIKMLTVLDGRSTLAFS